MFHWKGLRITSIEKVNGEERHMVSLPFALYYISVVLYWLISIMKALRAKAILRSLLKPSKAKRYFALAYLWEMIYTVLALFGYITLTDDILRYDNGWLLYACVMLSAVYFLHNAYALIRLPFEDLTPVLERARMAIGDPAGRETHQ